MSFQKFWSGSTVTSDPLYSLSQKKLYNFQFLIAEKVNTAQQQHSGGQKHNFPVCKKIFKLYHSMVGWKSYDPLSDEW